MSIFECYGIGSDIPISMSTFRRESAPDGFRFTLMFLASEAGYREWRAAKLNSYPRCVNELAISINGLTDLNDSAKVAIRANCRRANMAIYSCRDTTVDGAAIRAFAGHFGLRRLDHHLCANEDGVAELTVAHADKRTRYAPYSQRGLSWHTDGYYNERSRQVNAVILHCAQHAVAGGKSALLDPEIAYIRLRDENPKYIAAFEHPACMTIPANVEDGVETRPEVTGPVFSYDQPGGIMHMRFSARKRNIRWRDDRITTAAREFLSELLSDEEGPAFHYDLQPGQGIISNNVLHNRTAFEDGPDQKRLLYRARFFDRIDRS